jgi:hypothetical protein
MATLCREGDELDDVLAELDTEYPEQVRVCDVTYRRDGGVLGFFARRRVVVHYTVDGFAPLASSQRVSAADDGDAVNSDPSDFSAFEELIQSAQQSERSAQLAAGMVESGRATDVPEVWDDQTTNVEFARMLLDMATQKAAQRRSASAPVAGRRTVATVSRVLPARPATGPTRLGDRPEDEDTANRASIVDDRASIVDDTERADRARPVRLVEFDERDRVARHRCSGAHRASDDVDLEATLEPTYVATSNSTATQNPLMLRRRLADLGVPVNWIPAGSADPYWVVGQLVDRLPIAPVADVRPGETFVVAGPATAALRAARTLCARLRLDPRAVHLAGSSAGDGVVGSTLTQPWQAQELVAQARAARVSPIVVVATDSQSDDAGDHSWATAIIGALEPQLVWLVIDASSKPADCAALIDQIGEVDGLVLTGAARSTSPASVWQLHKPVAMLDGHVATRGAWTALLIDKLTESE